MKLKKRNTTTKESCLIIQYFNMMKTSAESHRIFWEFMVDML